MKTSEFRTVDALLALLMVSGLYLSVLWGDDFTYSIFTDRDLYRAYAIGEEFQYLGSESMYHLARVPGEVMAYLFWALQAVNPSTAFIHAAAVTMNAIGLLLIPVLFRRFLGWTGALAVAAFYAGALIVLEELWKFWNPSITPLFAVLVWWCLLAYVEDGRRWRLLMAFACIGLAAQFHMSFYTLVPLIVVFLLAAGRRPSWADWALSLGVLVLTLLPYFALDAANGFFNTRHLLTVPEVDPELVAANEVTEGSGWTADRLILAIARLTGGRSFPENTVPAVIASNPVIYWGATAVFNCGLIALASFAVWGVAAVIGGRTGPLSRGFGRTEWALVVVLAIAIAIASKTVNNNQGRYLIALLMPALLLVGVGFRNLREAADRGKLTRIGAVVAILLVLGLVTKHGAIGYYYATAPRESNSSYAVKRTIVEMLKSEFGWVAEDIDFKVGLWHDGGRYKDRSFKTDENAALSYIARVVPDSTAQERYDGCAIVQTTERRRTAPPPSPVERVIADLPLKDGVVVDRVVTRGDVRVIGYRTDNPNCVRSFGNAYLPTPEERAAARVVDDLPEGGHAAEDLPGGGTRLFARLPNGSPMALDVIEASGGLRTVLHANSLRGIAASYRIERSSLESYRLRFSPSGGGPSIVVPGRYPLGRDGLYTPWKIGPVDLPKGRYAVELIIERYTERHLIARRMASKTSGPHRIQLAEEFSW